MAFLTTPDEQRRILRGEQEDVIALPGSSPQGFGGQSFGGTEFSTPAVPTGQPQETGQAPRPFFQGSSLQDISGSLGRISGDLSGRVEAFREAAGPSRQFGEAEQGILRTAAFGGAGAASPLAGAQPSEAALESARGLVGAQFTGPSGLSEEFLARGRAQLGQAQRLGRELQSGRGLVEQQQLARPGLSRGQAEFEARRRGRGFQREAADVAGQATRGLDELLRESQAAQQFAGQRAQEEADIARQSREFLGGLQDPLTQQLEQRAADENRAQAAIEEAFRQFQETGSLSGLLTNQALSPEQRAQVEGFASPFVESRIEAQRAREEVDRRFRDISDIAPATLTQTRTGFEQPLVNIGGQNFVLDPRQGGVFLRAGGENINTDRVNIPGMSPEESDALAKRLQERQGILNSLFAGRTTLTPERGRFAGVTPGFGSAAFGLQEQPQLDARDFLQLTGGEQATVSNVGTQAEIDALNRISGLLGQTGQLTRRDREALGFTGDAEDFQQQIGKAEQALLRELAAGEAQQRAQLIEARRAAQPSSFFDQFIPDFVPTPGADIVGPLSAPISATTFGLAPTPDLIQQRRARERRLEEELAALPPI